MRNVISLIFGIVFGLVIAPSFIYIKENCDTKKYSPSWIPLKNFKSFSCYKTNIDVRIETDPIMVFKLIKAGIYKSSFGETK